MFRLTALFALVAAAIITGDAAAQDLPAPDVLHDIVAKLRQRPISHGSTFEPAKVPAPAAALAPARTVTPVPALGHARATIAACLMQRFTMTLASGSPAAHAISVLLDRAPEEPGAAVTLMTILPRLAVDADGSPRAYHPEDPDGVGTCTKDPPAPAGDDRGDHYSGVCALDNFTSGDIQVFKAAMKLRGAERAAEWKTIWPLIRDQKIPSIDLKQQVSSAPDGYYFFYYKARELSAFFKQDVIPRTSSGYPCMQDAMSRYPGYFVASTTLQRQGAKKPETTPEQCAQSHFIDAEQIPFLVVPDDAYGNARIGDIVVARLEGSKGARFVYGIVADTSSPESFGEASIAFNRALELKPISIQTGRDVLALDIRAPVAVLILAGSKAALNGDYSLRNIVKVGSAAFARWSNDQQNSTRRFDACLQALRGRGKPGKPVAHRH
jgi:hypothetical protein